MCGSLSVCVVSKMFLQCWFLLQINVFFGEENIFLTPEAYALFGWWFQVMWRIPHPYVCVCDDDDVDTHANIALKVRYVRFLSLSRMNKPLGFFRICLRTG